MVYLGVGSHANSSNSTSSGSIILPRMGSSSSNGSQQQNRSHLHLQQQQNRNNGAANRESTGEDEEDRDEDGGDEESEEREGRIRVGRDFQATYPNYIPVTQRRPEQTPERALLVWSPAENITTGKLDEFIQVSKEKFGYNAEQALGMLFWHKHDLDRAIQDLANFTPFPDEWTVEDKVLFEQAFQFHGKSFHRIRQMLPDKSIAQLVKYYYGWKKTRTRTSLMDRQARKLQVRREEQGIYGDNATTVQSGATTSTATPSTAVPEDESEVEEEKETTRKPKCFNCGILCHVTHPTPKGQMCGTCHQYYTGTGNVRPTTAPMRKDGTKSKHSIFKNNNQPPKGMYVNHDDLVSLATGPQSQGEALLKSMDREIVSYKRVVQNNKQYLSALQRRTKDRSSVEPYRIPDASSKINARWTNEELLLGVQGIRKFGKNFKVISEVIGTKSESHVRSFFVNYRRRYNLDAALKEYEAENGPSQGDDDDVRMLDGTNAAAEDGAAAGDEGGEDVAVVEEEASSNNGQ